MNEKPKRRWLQFGLRGLLLLLVMIAVPLGWTAYERREIQKRRDDFQLLESLGGKFKRDRLPLTWRRKLLGLDPTEDVIFADLWRSRVVNAQMVHLQGLTALRTLWLRDTRVTDADLAYLRGMTHLEELDLCDTQISSSGLAHLRGLKQLRKLYFSNARSISTGMENLQDLTRLEVLWLIGAPINDSEVAFLQHLKRLKYLSLVGTRVTDRGTTCLLGLENLQTLDLRNTGVTPAAIERLKTAMPKVRVMTGDARLR